MLHDLIEQQAFESGVLLVGFSFKTDIKAAYYKSEGSLAVAAISLDIEDPHDWNVQALHEIKHHETCAYDLTKVKAITQHYFENLADRTMLKDCMPLPKIIRAYQHGCTCLCDFADYCEITEEFFIKGLRLYGQICGPTYHFNNYLLTFDPFDIVKI